MQPQPQQTTFTTTQAPTTSIPFSFPISIPEAGPSGSILLMLTFCVWLLRQQIRDSQ
ncbi:MAG: hypothetical protein J7641_00850 [Cyanobacteria bacterium SID2]|nr:hypothetical protein [Cyanobacteria bacterium SID2]MBP0002390.1 hypothetical protein [Cyanobacteria bacterium SBC]